MLMLSKKVEYGLMALLHIDANAVGQVISSKEISDHYSLPADLLGKVLQALARTGLVEAEHGSRGGYRLVRPLESISLGEVITAIEGPTKLVRCQHDAEECSQFSTCNVKGPLNDLHDRLQDFIYSITLEQLRTTEGFAARMGK